MKQCQLSVPSGGEHRHTTNFKVVHTLEMYIHSLSKENRRKSFFFNFEHFFFKSETLIFKCVFPFSSKCSTLLYYKKLFPVA